VLFRKWPSDFVDATGIENASGILLLTDLTFDIWLYCLQQDFPATPCIVNYAGSTCLN